MKPDIWQLSTPVQYREKPVKQAVSVTVSPELTTLKGALDAIPNDSAPLDYDQWRNVVFAIHHATSGSDEGLALAHAFSSRSGKYDPDFLDNRVWPYVGKTSGPSITEKSIYHLATKQGWVDPSITDDFESLTTPVDIPHTKRTGKRFEFVKAADFSAGAPPGWIVKHVIPRATLGVIYGESGAGKSFQVLDLLGHIVEDRDWRGHKVTKGLTAGYIAAEGAAGFRLRLNAFNKHHATALDRLAVMAGAPSFIEREDIIELGKAMLSYGRLDLLVVDTLAQVTAGANENSGEDMGRVIAHCQTLHQVTGAMVLLVHHSGKDASKGARGWSGIKGALDVELEVTRNGEQRCMTVSKLKDGQGEGKQFGFKLSNVVLGVDDDGEDFGSCVVEHTATTRAEPAGKVRSDLQRLILRTLEDLLAGRSDDFVPMSELVQAVADQRAPPAPGSRDTRKQTTGKALDKLVGEAVLSAQGGSVRFAEGDLSV